MWIVELPPRCRLSTRRNGIPMFPRWDLCGAHKSKSDKSGQVGTSWESWASGAFYLNEGVGGYPRPPPICSHLNEGTTNREMAAAQSPTNRDKGPVRVAAGVRQPSLCLEIWLVWRGNTKLQFRRHRPTEIRDLWGRPTIQRGPPTSLWEKVNSYTSQVQHTPSSLTGD